MDKHLDLETIAKRKAEYGDSFQEIADRWHDYISNNTGRILPEDVAEMMAILKDVRIEGTIDLVLKETEAYSDTNIARVEDYCDNLRNSYKDRDNYRWIADNFEKYKEM